MEEISSWVIKMCLLCLAFFCFKNSNLIAIVLSPKTCQLLSQVSLSWHLIKYVNCVSLNWQLKMLMFGSKIGVKNVSKGSKGSIGNYL